MEDLNLLSDGRLGLAESCCRCDGLSALAGPLGDDAPSRPWGRARWWLRGVPHVCSACQSSLLLPGFALRGVEHPLSHSWVVEARVSGRGVSPVLDKLPERGLWDVGLPRIQHSPCLT